MEKGGGNPLKTLQERKDTLQSPQPCHQKSLLQEGTQEWLKQEDGKRLNVKNTWTRFIQYLNARIAVFPFVMTLGGSTEYARCVERSGDTLKDTYQHQSCLKETASTAESRISTIGKMYVSVLKDVDTCLPCKDSENFTDVYNLKVDGESEFFANNILVHNCDSLSMAVRLLCDAPTTRTEKAKTQDDKFNDLKSMFMPDKKFKGYTGSKQRQVIPAEKSFLV
jgi:hypothetical protein